MSVRGSTSVYPGARLERSGVKRVVAPYSAVKPAKPIIYDKTFRNFLAISSGATSIAELRARITREALPFHRRLPINGFSVCRANIRRWMFAKIAAELATKIVRESCSLEGFVKLIKRLERGKSVWNDET